MEDIEMNNLLRTEATKPNIEKQSERRTWKLTLGSVLSVFLTLCAVGVLCWSLIRSQTLLDVDVDNNRPRRQSMCERTEKIDRKLKY